MNPGEAAIVQSLRAVAPADLGMNAVLWLRKFDDLAAPLAPHDRANLLRLAGKHRIETEERQEAPDGQRGETAAAPAVGSDQASGRAGRDHHLPGREGRADRPRGKEAGDDLPAALQFHPLANLFPLIEGAEFDELVEDIASVGLRDPDIVLLDGQILDGRNRYRALRVLVERGQCAPHEIDPARSWVFCKFEEDYDDIEPLAFVLSRNLRRRHLTESQRAMVAAKIATMRQGERTDLEPSANLPKVDQPTAARLLHVSDRSVRDAKAVTKTGVPDLQRAVERGDASVSAARVIAELTPTEQTRILREVAASPDGRRALKNAAKEVRAEDQAKRHVERQHLAEEISRNNPPFPDGRRWPFVLIDVPRKHNVYDDETGSEKAPDNHYPTMTFRELCDFPIDRFAAAGSIIVYASTAASLVDDLEILAEWGFVSLRPRDAAGRLMRDLDGEPLTAVGGGRYGSHQIWRKLRPGNATGMGRWFRDEHELYIVARRGDVPAPLPGTQPGSVFDAPWRGHSFKPGEEVRGWIDRCWPLLSKVEVFARGDAPEGWTFWGNQVRTAEGAPAATAATPVAETREAAGQPQPPPSPPSDDDLEIPANLRRRPAA